MLINTLEFGNTLSNNKLSETFFAWSHTEHY
jgi:hypothetical protein